ncbi:RodZ domain-containing protein [Rheinheimera maricola]|uniref:DUF4115 domain-containing protein n=1 Tax=Rheinheimera maricola TaxID=2793282 RepID=A0ABS7X9B6_9GAMM|nr:RodZ domain-containing protein [Rheinheimera maricola]MBZ9611397.1 DUF4115 domain-containing protein [Rheinheimera maricola]
MSDEAAKPVSAGQLLRQAREQRQMSIQQVALQLNLKAELVEKLELDQLDGTTLETFSRGYVRAYGRLLKLPETELMAALSRQSEGKTPASKPMRTFSNRAAHQAIENRFMWLTYAIIALLLVLLFVWWWQSARESTDVVFEQAVTDNAVVDNVMNIPQVQPVLAEPVSGAVTTDTALQEDNTASILTDLTPTTLTTEVAVEQTSNTAVAESIVQDVLEMRFEQRCWVNVVDATGNRVAYGTKQAGYIMQLSGEAPFEVTLGNPSVVEISLNQQVFDMSAFPGGRVAKFTIPESE